MDLLHLLKQKIKQMQLELLPQEKTFSKPFIKWAGGKTQLIPSIEKALPNGIKVNSQLTYVEPFVGGGAILFWVLNNFKNLKKAVINDINPDLIKSYQTIRDNPYELINALKDIQNEYYTLNSEDTRREYYMSKRAKYNTKKLDNVTNTALFIFINRTCFNGLYRVNSKGLYNVPFGKYINPTICDERTILSNSTHLQKVEMLNGDYRETLRFGGENTFFYFDPPYKPLSNTSSFNSYAKEVFDDNEQIRLKEFCNQISQTGSKFILSNSDVKSNDPENHFFDELYSHYNIQRVWASRIVNANPEKRGKLTELLITNF
jgi:DNA adenine methylase